MSTMELRTSLLKEVAAIIADDDLTAEALKALRALRRKSRVVHKEQEVEAPCDNDTVAVKKRAESALARYKQGEYALQDDMLKRTERWKCFKED